MWRSRSLPDNDEIPTEPDSNLDYLDYWPNNTGHIVQLNSVKTHRKKHPIGFSRTRARRHGDRVPGSFPDVPKFDVRSDAR